ncbi:MAG TPA: hypothetical protein VNQ79_10860 [Blastocatellia bacterium]|nr:hypothetical protein [Blastocatellia bacterium]
MKSAISFISHLLSVATLLTMCVFAQEPENNPLVANSEISEKTGFPGQGFMLALNIKKDTEPYLQLVRDGYEVEIIQGAFRQRVLVRHVALFKPAPQPGRPSAYYLGLYFVLPHGLVEGEAAAIAIHQGRRSNEHRISISAHPLPVNLLRFTQVIFPGEPNEMPPPDKRTPPPVVLETGKENTVYLKPIIDPDDKDSALLLTFKQNDQLFTARGRVIFHSPKDDQSLAPSPWEVLVRLPDGLVPGEAIVEVRVKIRGAESEPTTEKVQIRSSAEMAEEKRRSETAQRSQPPRLARMDPRKASVGQIIRLLVENRVNLEPTPGRTLIIIEQENRRYELKPLYNSAVNEPQSAGGSSPLKESDLPVFMAVRLGPDVLGEVTLKVLNPAQGPEAGLSNGLPLEIIADVIPPSVIEAKEALRSEVEALNQALRSAQGVQPQLDLSKRYIRMRAEGLSLGDFPEIRFEQAGHVSVYRDQQNLLLMDETMYLALPDNIEPGELVISVANRAGDRVSVPARAVVKITQPK